MTSLRYRVIERDDTEGSCCPFWSPDSQSKRSSLEAKEFSGQRGGATWGNGVILFPSSDGAILQVADTGGTATVLATLPWAAGKRAFGWPRFLPDGRRFLVTEVDDPAPYVASLDTPGTLKLPQDGARAVYAAGHLLFLRGVGAYARPFDAARVEFTGREVLLAERASFLSASATGTVLYRAEPPAVSRLTWFDRRGRPTATVGEAGAYQQVSLGPSGKRAAVVQLYTQDEGSTGDLVDVDLTTGIFSRLTTNPAFDTDPSWSPDERHVAFTSNRTGAGAVYLKDMNTGAEEQIVALKESFSASTSYSSFGSSIVWPRWGRLSSSSSIPYRHRSTRRPC